MCKCVWICLCVRRCVSYTLNSQVFSRDVFHFNGISFISYASDVSFSFTVDLPYNHLPFSLLFIFYLLANHILCMLFFHTKCTHAQSRSRSHSYIELFIIGFYSCHCEYFIKLFMLCVRCILPRSPFLYGCKPSLALTRSLKSSVELGLAGWLAGDQTFSDQLKSLLCTKLWLKLLSFQMCRLGHSILMIYFMPCTLCYS